MLSGFTGRRSADAEGVISGQCPWPVPALTCAAGNGRVRSSERRPRARVPSGATGKGKTGQRAARPGREGMRVIVRKERPHPGAQLRFTDIDGHRFTCFATDTRCEQLADLELRHRRRARCEDRHAKDTGLRSLPLHGFNQNQIWCELVAMACELTAWMQMLALDGPARAWEPKRLRLRLFSAADRIVRGGRRLRLRLAATWPWATEITTAITRLQALAPG